MEQENDPTEEKWAVREEQRIRTETIWMRRILPQFRRVIKSYIAACRYSMIRQPLHLA